MDSKKELRVAYTMAAILFIVGVVCYAAFSANVPEKEPIRRMFKTDAGKVLFQHKLHTESSGYGISCYDCHHHPESDESALLACGKCHGKGDEMDEATMKTCMECHDEDEVEGAEMTKSADAFHSQCIQCHKEFEKGPVECSECHVM